MADARQYEKLKSALSPAVDCPAPEQLAQALHASADDPRRKAALEHAATCAHCHDELALMREFMDVRLRPDEERNVNWIARRLAKQRVFRPSRQRLPFFFGMRAFATAACLVIMAASVFYMRRGPGELSPAGAGVGAMRSQAIELVGPIGDVRQKPVLLQWQAVTGAARYQVRMMEVDHKEVWRGEATDNFIPIPASVAAMMSPGRSFLWEVSARDKSGSALGNSGTRSFRVK